MPPWTPTPRGLFSSAWRKFWLPSPPARLFASPKLRLALRRLRSSRRCWRRRSALAPPPIRRRAASPLPRLCRRPRVERWSRAAALLCSVARLVAAPPRRRGHGGPERRRRRGARHGPCVRTAPSQMTSARRCTCVSRCGGRGGPDRAARAAAAAAAVGRGHACPQAIGSGGLGQRLTGAPPRRRPRSADRLPALHSDLPQ